MHSWRTALPGESPRGASKCPLVSEHSGQLSACIMQASGGRRAESTRPTAISGHHSALTLQQQPQRAIAPSEIANELHRYAAKAATSAAHPSIDAVFLRSRIDDLSCPSRLRRLRPRQLAALLRSLVRLGFHPGEDWLAELDACCYSHPGPFDPLSATVLLHSLAALQAASSASPPSPPPPSPTHTAPTHLGASHAHHRLHSSSSQAGRPRARVRTRPSSAPPSASFAAVAITTTSSASPAAHHTTAAASASPAASASTSASFSSSTSTSTAAAAAAAAAAPFRFPHAVYLRLLGGGVHKYSYEQLAKLLQAFRSLGVPVTEELATQVGARMARQLLEMEPERRRRALAAVVGSSSSS